MNHFVINGIEKPAPISPDSKFQDLVKYINQKMVNDRNLVSSLKVNGVEVTETDENALGGVRISDIESVEVNFTSPRELAEETLQILVAFTYRLSELSAEVAVAGTPDEKQFQKLINGLQTLIEVISTVKQVLRVGLLQPVNLLQADLLSIVKDMVDARESKDGLYLRDLLTIHLPENLKNWQETGVPALIRARDS